MTAREQAAGALRGLNHELVGRDAPDETLAEIARVADQLRELLGQYAPRRRPEDGMARDLNHRLPAQGELIDHFADCPISGSANPLSTGIVARREGDGVVCGVTLGQGWEGAPGRAHGGIVAAVFDDALGFVTQVVDVPSYAGELTIRYVHPTPIGEPLELRAHSSGRDGRRLYLEGTLEHRGTVVATAHGVNIEVGRDRLGRPAYDY
jgi:acyl-coenzyme A thioesterase PaaI-like protein